MSRLAPVLCALAAAAPAPAQRPNLVTVVTDDQGRWAMGAYGNREVRTPNMDRLAREGARFTQAFAQTPVCSPARATWLTGRYATELGIRDWISGREGREGVGLHARTWARVLQDHGYRTALVGKWHLGSLPRFHPTRLGFDHFYGFLGGGNRPIDPTLEVGGRRKKLAGPLPDLLTTEAIRWIRANAAGPFALALHFRAPHRPYAPVPEVDTAPYADLDPTLPRFPAADRASLARSTRRYYASISSVDRNLGRLLEALDALGLTQRTIVVFTSDHGYNEGRHGIDTKGNGHWIAGGVIGPKRPNMWDTSIAVPLVVRWPGVVEPGTRIPDLVSQVDMFRTLLGMCGVPVPEDSDAHGTDLSPLLRGGTLPPRDAVFGQYDLHNGGLAYLRMLRTARWKYVRHWHARGMDELYDLVQDPAERHNLAGRARHRDVVARLRDRLLAWMRSIGDPLLADRY